MSDHVYSQPMLGAGTTLAAATASYPALTGGTPPATIPLAWIVDIKTDFSVGVHEWGNLAQTVGRQMPTIFKAGNLSGTLQFLPGDTSNKTLWGLFKAKTVVYWVIALPDTSTIEFNGFVSKVSPASEQQDEVDADFEIAIDGDVHVTPVAT